jgi:hypothetical protein
VIVYTLWKWMMKNYTYVPDDVLEEASAARYQNVAYKIKITIPERIGKIYTIADRETDQRNRRKCYDGVF